ncbi:MAG: hypothetical protein ACLVJ6_11215 [Merdibacter sp.]
MEVIKIEGSVELAILGLCDAIVDMWKTGTTLRKTGSSSDGS